MDFPSPKTSKKHSLFSPIFSIDFFSMHPMDCLTFENSHRFSTPLGKLTTWLLIIFCAYFFFSFAKNMIFHLNPKVIKSETLFSNGDLMDLNDLRFFMAFSLENMRNNSEPFIDDSIYSIEIFKNNKDGSSIKIPFSRCSNENLQNNEDFRDFFQKKKLNQFFCVNGQKSKKFTLKTDDFLQININRCSNLTNSDICATFEKITENIESSNLGIYLLKNVVDPSNYEKPFTNFIEEFHFPINSINSKNNLEILLNQVSFFNDNGIVFENLQEINSFSDEPHKKSKTLGSEANNIYQIELKIDKIKINYKRSYEKLQNVLAYICGTMKALLFVLNIILFPITRFQFRVTTFRFKTPKEAKAIIKKKIQPKTPKTHAIKFSKLEESYFMNYFTSNDKRLHISSLSHYFRCFRNSLSDIFNRLLNKGLNQMDRVLDISYILHKLTEIETLKVLLLDETQKDLFDMIPKPEVGLYEGMKTDAYRRISKSFQRKKIRSKSAFNEFQIIANKSQKSEIDEKLLEMWPKLKKIKEKDKTNDSENITKSDTIIGQFKPVRVSKFHKKVQKGYKYNSIELLSGNNSYS